MKLLFRIVLVLLLAACLAPAQQQRPPLDAKWLTLPSPPIEVNGLPWLEENKGELLRLPLRVKDAVPKDVWSLSQDPSGGRIRFRTDSQMVAIRLEYPRPPDGRNLHAFGQTGVDLYLDGMYRSTAVADKESKPGRISEFTYFNAAGGPRVEHEIVLYLPTYFPVKVHGIGLDKEAKIRPPKPFALSKPIVFYGTSITQGGCASRPGMAYQAIVGRRLNVDFVNLGFSGAGKGEPVVRARLRSEQSDSGILGRGLRSFHRRAPGEAPEHADSGEHADLQLQRAAGLEPAAAGHAPVDPRGGVEEDRRGRSQHGAHGRDGFSWAFGRRRAGGRHAPERPGLPVDGGCVRRAVERDAGAAGDEVSAGLARGPTVRRADRVR
jgi:hypothetical protein